jgi:hypothetical protein
MVYSYVYSPTNRSLWDPPRISGHFDGWKPFLGCRAPHLGLIFVDDGTNLRDFENWGFMVEMMSLEK